MTDHSPISRLGVYMRAAARALGEIEPVTAAQIRPLLIGCPDVPYAHATLMRLAERGIATEIEGGFVRGPRWQEAAHYYGWKE
jgi:hypothetical protein